MFAICVEAIIYLLLYNLHDCIFKEFNLQEIRKWNNVRMNENCSLDNPKHEKHT